MAEHGGVNAAFAPEAGPFHRFIAQGGVGPGVADDGELLGGSVETVGELFGALGPFARHSLREGMVIAHGRDGEVVTRAVADAGSIGRRDENGFASLIDYETGAEGVVAPAETDDLVVFGPFGEGVIGGVEDDDATTATEVAKEVFFHGEGPAFGGGEGAAVVVEDDDIGARKRWPPSGGTARRNADLEATGGFEDLADGLGGGGPVVVILSIDDEGAEFARGEEKKKTAAA